MQGNAASQNLFHRRLEARRSNLRSRPALHWPGLTLALAIDGHEPDLVESTAHPSDRGGNLHEGLPWVARVESILNSI